MIYKKDVPFLERELIAGLFYYSFQTALVT
jgi:hypothetical protein